MSETFLTAEEVGELTGILAGRRGKRREELQAEWLRSVGIPFWVNARGRPIIPRTAIEGTRTVAEPPKKKWMPAVMNEDGTFKDFKETNRCPLPTLKERRRRS
jgi:hypothetical protein